MDRKSATRRIGSCKSERHCGFHIIAALSTIILYGCCPSNFNLRPKITVSPIKEAEFLFSEHKGKKAISILKNAIKEDRDRCQASFFLIFLDKDKQMYRDILKEQSCQARYPLFLRVLKAYDKQREKYKKCRHEAFIIKKQKKQCLLQKEKLKKEKDKISFELKKLEQIRKETERLRLKK